MTCYTSLIDTEHAYLAWFAEHLLESCEAALGTAFTESLTLTIRPCVRVKQGYELILTTKFFTDLDEPCYRLLTLTGSVVDPNSPKLKTVLPGMQNYRIQRYILPLVAATAGYPAAHACIEFYKVLGLMLMRLPVPGLADPGSKDISLLVESYRVDVSRRPDGLYANVIKMLALRRSADELGISFKD